MFDDTSLKIDDALLMWLFTIILIFGLIIVLTPVIATGIFEKDFNFGIWAIGTESSIMIHKTSATVGAAMVIFGLFGAILIGTGNEKGRETFVRMYSIY